ncbi:MAG TPA: DoxX family protein [Candidatus Acidoferrales bacterium]|nr:DoxX family protein [Candidatus Acidoferrales bacterium]
MSDSADATSIPSRLGSDPGSLAGKGYAASARFSDVAIAYAILRVSLGANIFLHGLDRFLIGHAAFLAYLNHYFEHAHLISASSLPAFAAVLPYLETGFGLLVILGLATRFALIGGAFVMLCLVVGTNLAQDWIVSGLQLIYCFLYYYLLAHRDQNFLSLDRLFRR